MFRQRTSETLRKRQRCQLMLEQLEDRLAPAFLGVLDVGHADVGVALEDDGGTLEWHLHVHDGAQDIEYAPAEVLLRVGPSAETTRPAGDADWGFLGIAGGAPLWILPQTEDASLLFLGIGTEEFAAGLVQDDEITLTLVGVSGPRHFALYQTDAFGEPLVRMASADGIDAGDAVVLSPDGHQHAHWAFTQAGLYEITFEATASDGTPLSSGPVTYYFFVAQDVPSLPVVIDHEHTDLRFDRNPDGSFVTDREYRIQQDVPPDLNSAAAETLVWAGAAAEAAMPVNPAFDFIGAADGETIWILPAVQNPNVAWLGFSAADSGPAPLGGQLPLQLMAVRGPGDFSLYTTNGFGVPTVLMATSDGISAADVYILFDGAHAHANWAFSRPGFYEIDLQVSADYGGGNVHTKLATYYFAIGLDNVPPIHNLPASVHHGDDATPRPPPSIPTSTSPGRTPSRSAARKSIPTPSRCACRSRPTHCLPPAC